MAKAYDVAGNFASSTPIKVGVAAVISGETGSTPQFGEIHVSWSTDRPTNARVVYDTVQHSLPNLGHLNYGYAFSTAPFDLAKTLNHQTTLTSLNNQTTYYYRFISAGSPAAVSGEMSNRTFSIPGPGSPPSGGAAAASPLLASTPSVLGTSTYYYTPTGSTPSDEGEVLGEETDPEKEKSIPVITTPTPKILGAFTSTSPFYLFGGGLLISLILMILLFRRK